MAITVLVLQVSRIKCPLLLLIYMTKCQKVRKSWVKFLTVNKIWSNYVVLVLCLESVQKWQKKQQWTQYKLLCWSAYGDICISRRRFKLWNWADENGNVTVTDFFDDYVHVYNT